MVAPKNDEPIAGIDEAGRGPWAGPVVAAAVVLGGDAPEGLTDSKKLSARKRETIYDALWQSARIGVGQATREEIDAVNILRATELAMCRALAALLETGPVSGVLIDGNRVPKASRSPPAPSSVGTRKYQQSQPLL